MNIGLFSDVYLPQISGVTTVVDTLDKELTRMGHNVFIISTKYPNFIDESDKILRLPSIEFIFDKSCRVGSLYSKELMNKIRNLNLDIVHTHTEFSIGVFGRTVAKELNIPFVHTYHTMYEDYIYHNFGKNIIGFMFCKILIGITKFHLNKSLKVIAPSYKVKDLLDNYKIKTNIEVVPNGIDLAPFDIVSKEYDLQKINNLKKDIGLNINDKVILNIGRQSKEKNVELIVSSLKELKNKINNIKLVIIGDGPNRVDLEKFVDGIGLKNDVVFLGKKPRKDIEKYYKIADLFVTASTFETQGLTIIESMASNVPVAVKKDKAFDGLIENHVTGFVFEKDEELTDLLYKFFTNIDLANIIKSNSIIKVKDYSSENFVKNIENIYKEALK